MTLQPVTHRAEADPTSSGTTTVLRLRPRRAWLPRPLDAAASGCGWFESSRELAEGLEVIECTWDGPQAWPLND